MRILFFGYGFTLLISSTSVAIRLLFTGFCFFFVCSWLRLFVWETECSFSMCGCACENICTYIWRIQLFFLLCEASRSEVVSGCVCVNVQELVVWMCVCVFTKANIAYGCMDHVIYSGWLRTRIKFQPKFRCRSCFYSPFTQLWMRYITAHDIVLFLLCFLNECVYVCDVFIYVYIRKWYLLFNVAREKKMTLDCNIISFTSYVRMEILCLSRWDKWRQKSLRNILMGMVHISIQCRLRK